jgi:hypothetical protein
MSENEQGNIVDVISRKAPEMVSKLLNLMYSPEAGENLGKAVGNFYKALLDAGVPQMDALRMSQDYMFSFRDVLRGMKGQARPGGPAWPGARGMGFRQGPGFKPGPGFTPGPGFKPGPGFMQGPGPGTGPAGIPNAGAAHRHWQEWMQWRRSQAQDRRNGPGPAVKDTEPAASKEDKE